MSAPAAAVAQQPAASTSIPFKPETTAGNAGAGMPVAAVACVVLLVIAIMVLRRWGPRSATLMGRRRAVEVLESTRLADRTRVSLIRYRGRELLLAHSDQAMAILADEPADAALPPPRQVSDTDS